MKVRWDKGETGRKADSERWAMVYYLKTTRVEGEKAFSSVDTMDIWFGVHFVTHERPKW